MQPFASISPGRRAGLRRTGPRGRLPINGFLQTPDFSSDLSRVSAPVLLIWGDRDTYTTESDQRRLRAVLPGARSITCAGAGHAIRWEDPSRIASDLLAFVFRLAAVAA